jgi:hypothetical protein
MPTARQRLRRIARRVASIERPVCFKHIRERCGQATPTVTVCSALIRADRSVPCGTSRHARATKVDRIRFLFTMLNNPRFDCSMREIFMDAAAPGSGVWWSQTGSNRRPHACKARALPTELWPLSRTRMSVEWWAWEDLNLRPHAYQARALTN